jgi:hypothetical protein
LRIAALTLSLGFSLFMLEAGLRLLTPYPVTENSNKRDHERLGYVLSSDLPDVDEQGFRNRGRTLADADLVVVGDSHVQGFGVTYGEDFPSQLGERTGRRVYSLGVGSYGIYHYAVLLADVARDAGQVRDVILGLYPANDLTGFCSITPIASWAEFSAEQGLAAPACGDAAGSAERISDRAKNVRDWLLTNSAFINAIDLTVGRYRESTEPRLLLPARNQVRVARARRHARATSLDDVDRQTVFDASLKVLRRADRRFASQGIRFQVVLIPSKELVLYEWAAANGSPIEEEFHEYLRPQAVLMARYAAFLESNGIAFRDATPAMVVRLDAAIGEGRTLYPIADDGHPDASGFGVYTEVAAELLEGGS